MSEVAKLIVAILFSLHQYLPSVDEKAPEEDQKLFNSVLELKDMDPQIQEALIFTAAHRSCRYMIKVFVNQATGGNGDQSGLSAGSQMALKVFGGQMGINAAFENLNNSGYQKRMSKAGVDLNDIKEIVTHLCSENFDESRFTTENAREVR